MLRLVKKLKDFKSGLNGSAGSIKKANIGLALAAAVKG